MPRKDKGPDHIEKLGRAIQAQKTVKGGFKAFVDQTVEDALEILDELEEGTTTFNEARAALSGLRDQVPGIAQSIVVGTKAEGE